MGVTGVHEHRRAFSASNALNAVPFTSGIIFGNLMHGISQNPSTVAQLRPNAILGFAMCETMGLFSLALAGAILFAV